jgi:hypothetical protein
MLAWSIYALFHGSFDYGDFEVRQTQPFSSRQFAVIARRSDHQALNGDQYFVVVGDHPFSSADLKYAYYHDRLVFRAGSDCLTVRWEDAHQLVVACPNRSIEADQIAVQRSQIADMKVSYENIPMKSGR